MKSSEITLASLEALASLEGMYEEQRDNMEALAIPTQGFDKRSENVSRRAVSLPECSEFLMLT